MESGDFDFNLMKYWQISPVFTHEVGLLIKFHVLTDSATWNPGVTYGCEKGFHIPMLQILMGFRRFSPLLYSRYENLF